MKTLIQPFHSLSRILQDSDHIALSNPYFDAHTLWCPQWHTEGNKFTVRVAVPGMTKDDLSIHLEGRVLVVSTKESTSKENIMKLKRNGFKHFITLPDGIDTNGIKARCKHGLLSITLDKQDRTKKHTVIKVQGSEDGEKQTGRLDLWWNKIKEKMDVRKFVHPVSYH